MKALIEDDNYEVFPRFSQQIGNKGNGIIDGHIEIKPSRVIIETKLNGLELINKLVKYTESYKSNEYKILIHLSSNKYSDTDIEKIEKEIELKNIKNVNFQSITYQDLVDQLNQLADNYSYDFQIQRLSSNFENYCQNSGLMPRSKHVLRAMACGKSFDLNIKHKFYFDLASRGYSKFNYLGIYRGKTVKYIGRVENMIEADWNPINGFTIKDSTHVVTDDQFSRLEEAIKDSFENGWEINNNHRFFLLKEFSLSNFKKTSPGGIFRVRYFNLENILDEVPDSVEEIGNLLSKVTWE